MTIGRPVKVLSVDDSAAIRLVVANAFRSCDCEILTAANGVEGLAIASREMPDLIILDVAMPVMDGVTMLTRLKADPQLKPIPVIMLSAEPNQDDVALFTELGARECLVKPFQEEQFLASVGRLVPLRKKVAA